VWIVPLTDINLDVVWDTVQQDLPLLKKQIEALLFNRRMVQAQEQDNGHSR
jgi:uncharacterized protein with HEPN domain